MPVRKLRINRTAKKTVKPAPKAEPVKKNTFRRKVAEKVSASSGATGYSGIKGFRQAKVEKEKSEDQRRRRNIPWNLWLPPGSSAKTIILDKEGYFMYEHEIKDASGNRSYERCIKETGHCPLCSKTGREGYYVMKLTCLDMRGYKPKAGSTSKPQKVVKRVMNVKQAQMSKFERFFLKYNKSFRGLKLEHARDGEKESVIGADITCAGKMNETELRKYGDELLEVVDFNEAFPEMTEEQMAKNYGVKGIAGSADFDKDGEEEDDDGGWD